MNWQEEVQSHFFHEVMLGEGIVTLYSASKWPKDQECKKYELRKNGLLHTNFGSIFAIFLRFCVLLCAVSPGRHKIRTGCCVLLCVVCFFLHFERILLLLL
jgi:hypothetical protein